MVLVYRYGRPNYHTQIQPDELQISANFEKKNLKFLEKLKNVNNFRIISLYSWTKRYAQKNLWIRPCLHSQELEEQASRWSVVLILIQFYQKSWQFLFIKWLRKTKGRWTKMKGCAPFCLRLARTLLLFYKVYY